MAKEPFKYDVNDPQCEPGECKNCGKDVLWTRTKNDKPIMIDHDGVCHWEEGRCSNPRPKGRRKSSPSTSDHEQRIAQLEETVSELCKRVGIDAIKKAVAQTQPVPDSDIPF